MTIHLMQLRNWSAAAAFVGAVAAVVPAAAQTIDLGTDSIGSVVNTTGSTLAKIISQHSGITVRARAFAGPEAWMPEVDAGRIALGAHFMASFYTAFNQYETKLHLPNLRIIRSSRGISPLGFVVRADSTIKSVADLKGKRVSGVYSGQPVIRVLSGAAMGAYGLSYKDVLVVPAVNVVQGVAAVVDGRVDAAWASPSMPQIRQAHAKVGVRFIPLNSVSPQQEDTIRKQSFPSVYIDKFGGPRTPWLPAGSPMLTQEMYLGASTHTPDDVVTKVLAALWSGEADLLKAHPVMGGFHNKAAVTARPGVPYHPAAIAFYREKGVWTKESDAANAAVTKK
jgi:TRAP transporter TAXI family solute receptor